MIHPPAWPESPETPLTMVVERLTNAQIRVVYPLMREVTPALSLTHWLRHARGLAGGDKNRREGILVVRRSTVTHPSGAVCYRRDRDIRYGMMLTAEHFIALDLLAPQAVLSALLAELDQIAGLLGCSAIRSIVHGNRPDLVQVLRTAGHLAEGVTMTKCLGVPGGP